MLNNLLARNRRRISCCSSKFPDPDYLTTKQVCWGSFFNRGKWRGGGITWSSESLKKVNGVGGRGGGGI